MKKITTSEITQNWVQGASDTLDNTPQQNKAIFDKFPSLIAERLNEVVDDCILDDETTSTIEEAYNESTGW